MNIDTIYCGVSNRIFYFLNLRNSSTAVNAACASFLMTIHHDRQSLLMSETDLTIVDEINAICNSGHIRILNQVETIFKNDTCCSFDDEANNHGRRKKAFVIILKRISNAVCDNDHILAVLKDSAVNQND